MKTTLFAFGIFFILLFFVETVQPTCVLESDFGFKINCAFKKSGLFRVRNLGGIKAHASLGFSLGDELGFEQSLTNLDPSRRRSVNIKNGAVPNFIADTSPRPANKQEKRGKQNRIMMRPMAPPSYPNQAAMDKLTSLHRHGPSTMKPIIVSGPIAENPTTLIKVNPTVTIAKPMPMGVPPFRPLPPKEDTLKVLPIAASTRKTYTPLQIPQSKGPGPLQQSENYPFVSHDQVSKMVSQMTLSHVAQPLLKITPTPIIVDGQKFYSLKTTLNPFVPMPIAAPPTQAMTIIPAPILKNSMQTPLAPSKTPTHFTQNTISIHKTNPISNFVDPVPHQVHDLANMYPVYSTKKVDDYNSITGYGDDVALKFNKEDINAKIAEIARAGNISMEAVEAAIALRQQQLLSKYANIPLPTTSSTTTTTTSTTEEPLVYQPEPEPEILRPTIQQKPKRNPTSGKVMNAPREYYPVGYEKNFDDHFQSKVDLPDTNFHCGDQKYFPGLYGDEGLGCMVFHVCALTDDGLVMKSFLCPESTLFDQTILKCNWWFYVDCKNTRRLYDTNIPVSKSYQLMKALTFFSSYNKDMKQNQSANPEDVDGIKEAISLLQNQDTKQVQIITAQPYVDAKNNIKEELTNETTPIYRSNRNYNNNSNRSSSKRMTTKRKGSEQITQTESNENKSSLNDSSSNVSIENLNDRKHRRRMTLRNNTTTGSTKIPTDTTTFKPIETTVKNQQLDASYFNSDIKQEKLTDLVEEASVLKEAEYSPPVRRFYRSSAENEGLKQDKEMSLVNSEKVQIIRPTSMARLVGEFATSSATIAELDAAVLGTSRHKKQVVTIVTTPKNENGRSPDMFRT